MSTGIRSGLITGASRGIGRTIAFRLAQNGFGLTVTSRNADDLAVLAAELRKAGAPEVQFRAADMADRAALPAIADLHAQHFGALDALVLSAGVGTSGAISTYPIARFDKTVEVNLAAALVLLQAAIPLLREAALQRPERGAKVIALSSITGAYAEHGLAVYGATKAAMLSLMDTVNLEESPFGVTATAIAPAYVDTDISDWVKGTIPADSMIPSRRYRVRRRLDLVAEPEDVNHEDPDVAKWDVRLLRLIDARRHPDGARVPTPLAARLSLRSKMAAAGSQGMVE